MALTEQALLAAIAGVQDPHTGKDFVSTRAVRNVQINGGDVAFDGVALLNRFGQIGRAQTVPVAAVA